MKSLNKVIIIKNLKYFILSICIASAFFILGPIINNSHVLFVKPTYYFKYIFFNFCWILSLALPISVLSSNFFTFNQLEIYKNIDPIVHNSFNYLVRSLFFIYFFLTVFMIYFNMNILPQANQNSFNYSRILKSNSFSEERVNRELNKQNQYYTSRSATRSELLEKIIESENNIKFYIENTFDRLKINGYVLHRDSAVLARITNSKVLSKKDFEWLPAAGFKTDEDKEDFLWRINDNIHKIGHSYTRINQFKFEIQKRLSLSSSILILFLFGSLFGFAFRDKELISIIIIFFTLFIYLILMKLSVVIVNYSYSFSIILLWLPNILVSIAVLLFYPYIRRKYKKLIEVI